MMMVTVMICIIGIESLEKLSRVSGAVPNDMIIRREAR